MNYKEVKDSGKRQEFKTGSVRDTAEGKGRYDLISPVSLARIAKHYQNGSKKYGDRNWEKGQPICRYLDSAIRHIYKHLEGHRDEDHLAAGAWNLLAAIHTEEMIERGLLPKELDDRPDYLKKDSRPFIEKG
ncbi:MAG: dATP/dGTP diphosphohydrolase domain-containing protein, partial [Clostridia bacterium]